MVKLVAILSNDPKSKSTTYLADDGKTYTLKGDLSARANNPGNISPTGAKAKGVYEGQYGAIGYLPSSNGPPVAVFPDLSQGQAAQLHLWQTPAYQNKTLNDAAAAWAALPYAGTLSSAAGVPGDTPVSSLSPEQLQAVIAAQKGSEGSSALSITDAAGKPVPVAQFFGSAPPTSDFNTMAQENIRAASMPPVPIPRPAPPGSLPAPAPLTPPNVVTLPSGKVVPEGYVHTDPVSGITYVAKNVGNGIGRLEPQRSGFFDISSEMNAPTVAGSVIRSQIPQALDQAKTAIGSKVSEVATNAGNTLNNVKDTIGSGLSSIGSMFGGLGNMFGSSPPAVPAPPTNWLPKPAPSNDRYLDPGLAGLPVNADSLGRNLTFSDWAAFGPAFNAAVPRHPPVQGTYMDPGLAGLPVDTDNVGFNLRSDLFSGLNASTAASTAASKGQNYGLPGYSGNDVPAPYLPTMPTGGPGTFMPGSMPAAQLPAPPPLVAPPVAKPMTLGTPPGTHLNMTSNPVLVPQPPPPVRLASGNMATPGNYAGANDYGYAVDNNGNVFNTTTKRLTAAAPGQIKDGTRVGDKVYIGGSLW